MFGFGLDGNDDPLFGLELFGYCSDDCQGQTGIDDGLFSVREGFGYDDDDLELIVATERFIDDDIALIATMSCRRVKDGFDDNDDDRELLEALEMFVDNEGGDGLDGDHPDRWD